MREEHVHEELGAYVLGALPSEERRAVEAHVAHCTYCRDELAQLSALPALLDRLSSGEATADLTDVPERVAPQVLSEVATRVRRLERRVRRWRAVAVAATLAAVVGAAVVALPEDAPDRPEPVVAAVRPVVEEAESVRGTISAYEWEWGTTVEIEAEGLPPRDVYVVWVVDDEGQREPGGSWGPTGDRSALVRSASRLHPDRLAAVEIRDDAGVLLLGADFPAP